MNQFHDIHPSINLKLLAADPVPRLPPPPIGWRATSACSGNGGDEDVEGGD